MKLSISNIAWDIPIDAFIYPLLPKYGYRWVEIAPKKYISDIRNPDIKEIETLNHLLKKYNLSIPAFQALLFWENNLSLFASDYSRKSLEEYMRCVIDLAEKLDTKVLVFGSPKNRIVPLDMNIEEAWTIAKDFFSNIWGYAHDHGVIIGLEANPPAYGGNFITNTYEAAHLVEEVANPWFRLHIDAGTLIFQEENLGEIFEKYQNIICHYHVSQPSLMHFGDSIHEKHEAFARVLREKKYKWWVSIEMLVKEEEGKKEIIEKSLERVSDIYF